MTPQEQFKEKLLKLKEAFLEVHPGMPVLLRDIHTQIKADPELVTIMSEADVLTVVRGLERQTNTSLASSLSKSTSSAKGKTKTAQLSIEDL